MKNKELERERIDKEREFDDFYKDRDINTEIRLLEYHRYIGFYVEAERRKERGSRLFHVIHEMRGTQRNLEVFIKKHPHTNFSDLKKLNRNLYESIRSNIVHFREKYYYS